MIVAIGHARKDEAYQHLTQLEEVWHAEGVYLSEAVKEERA